MQSYTYIQLYKQYLKFNSNRPICNVINYIYINTTVLFTNINENCNFIFLYLALMQTLFNTCIIKLPKLPIRARCIVAVFDSFKLCHQAFKFTVTLLPRERRPTSFIHFVGDDHPNLDNIVCIYLRT